MNEAASLQPRMTVETYLAFADAHPRERFQLLAGAAVAMSPATYRHQRICSNIDRALAPRLRERGCDSVRDFAVALNAQAEFMPEPDVLVRCGPVDDRRRWVNDPIVVFEVLSPSTMLDDRGYKLREYFRFSTLRHVVLVYQDEVRVEHWSRRSDDAWSEGPEVFKTPQDRLVLTAAGVTLSLADIYDGVAAG